MPRSPRFVVSLVALGSVLGVGALPSCGQGCILGRQCTPGIIGNRLFLKPGEREYTLNYRTFVADQHYKGTVEQVERHELNNFVVNRQNLWASPQQSGWGRARIWW